MAEITYNDLLGQLSGMEKDQFEGIGFGSKGFLENYQNDPNSLAVTQHDNFSKFEPIAKAYQESKTIPKGNFLSNMFNFSSADAAIPDQTYGLDTNIMGGMTLNPDGTISYNTATPQNLGFRSMVDMAADTENFMGQFNTPQAANRYSGMGQVGPVKSDMTAPRALDMERFAGVSKLGRNDEDVEQVEYFGTPSKFQNFKSKAKTGWESVKGGLQSLLDKTMLGKVAGGFDATNPNAFNYSPMLQDQIDLAMAGQDVGGLGWTVDDIGRFTSGPLRGQNRQSAFGTNNLSRQLHARLQSIKNRKIAQTDWSKNKQKELQAAIDKIEAARKKKAGYDLSGGWTSPSGRDHAGTRGIGSAASRRGAAPGQKGASKDWRSEGGRVGYGNGGLATLFTRRG